MLATLPRWLWIIIGVLVGGLIGLVKSSADSQLYGINVQGYGVLLSDQQAFENGLVEDFKGTKLFSDPVVYPHWTTEAGKKKLIYIVTGQYWDGQSQTRNGKTVAEWTPRCVITQTPYKPRIGIPDAKGQVVAEYPSVVQFLDALHRVYKVNYHYAWWAVYPVLTWIVGCAIVIGGIWPTLINLLTFGTLTRPPEVKAVSLWNILGTKRRSPGARHACGKFRSHCSCRTTPRDRAARSRPARSTRSAVIRSGQRRFLSHRAACSTIQRFSLAPCTEVHQATPGALPDRG